MEKDHKVTRTIIVSSSKWEKFGRRIELLKKKGILKSRSNTIEHLIAAFLGTTSQWIENHAYNGSEAGLEKNFLGEG